MEDLASHQSLCKTGTELSEQFDKSFANVSGPPGLISANAENLNAYLTQLYSALWQRRVRRQQKESKIKDKTDVENKKLLEEVAKLPKQQVQAAAAKQLYVKYKATSFDSRVDYVAIAEGRPASLIEQDNLAQSSRVFTKQQLSARRQNRSSVQRPGNALPKNTQSPSSSGGQNQQRASQKGKGKGKAKGNVLSKGKGKAKGMGKASTKGKSKGKGKGK